MIPDILAADSCAGSRKPGLRANAGAGTFCESNLIEGTISRLIGSEAPRTPSTHPPLENPRPSIASNSFCIPQDLEAARCLAPRLLARSKRNDFLGEVWVNERGQRRQRPLTPRRSWLRGPALSVAHPESWNFASAASHEPWSAPLDDPDLFTSPRCSRCLTSGAHSCPRAACRDPGRSGAKTDPLPFPSPEVPSETARAVCHAATNTCDVRGPPRRAQPAEPWCRSATSTAPAAWPPPRTTHPPWRSIG
jgi:hypothetical protein